MTTKYPNKAPNFSLKHILFHHKIPVNLRFHSKYIWYVCIKLSRFPFPDYEMCIYIFQVLLVWMSLTWMVWKLSGERHIKYQMRQLYGYNGDENSMCASFWNGTFESFPQAHFTVFREYMNHLSFWTVWVEKWWQAKIAVNQKKTECFIWVFPLVTLKTLKQADNWTIDNWNIYVGNETMLMVSV